MVKTCSDSSLQSQTNPELAAATCALGEFDPKSFQASEIVGDDLSTRLAKYQFDGNHICRDTESRHKVPFSEVRFPAGRVALVSTDPCKERIQRLSSDRANWSSVPLYSRTSQRD